jgi:outer membrane lipoprotein SlyB
MGIVKRPDLNIALGTLFGAGVGGVIGGVLGGRPWLWFGTAIGTVGGWLIANKERWVIRERNRTTYKSRDDDSV